MTQCGTCRFWSQPPEGERAGFGHCARYPPTVIITSLETDDVGPGYQTAWPETHQSDGCGEHQLLVTDTVLGAADAHTPTTIRADAPFDPTAPTLCIDAELRLNPAPSSQPDGHA